MFFDGKNHIIITISNFFEGYIMLNLPGFIVFFWMVKPAILIKSTAFLMVRWCTFLACARWCQAGWAAMRTKAGLLLWCGPKVGSISASFGELTISGSHDFPFSWECHHPNWRTHFFLKRGRYTTNQLDMMGV